MKKLAFLYMTHIWNEEIENRIKKIKYDLEGLDIDFYIIEEHTDSSLYENNETYRNCLHFEFSYDELFLSYPLFRTRHPNIIKRYQGNSCWPIFNFLEKHNYEYIYFTEYDCIFTGNYKNIFSIDYEKYDIIFQSKPTNIPLFWWWTDREIYAILTEKEHCKHVLFNHYLVKSNVFLQLKNYMLNKGWYGHYEMIIPTMIEYYNFKYDYFSRYFKSVLTSWDKEFEEYMDKHDNILEQNTFYHPIKK